VSFNRDGISVVHDGKVLEADGGSGSGPSEWSYFN
jgi:hypothetical protein